MSSRLKLTLEILGFLAVAVIIGWGIWFVFFRTPAVPTEEEDTAGEQGRLPAIGEGFGGRTLTEGEDQSLRTLGPSPEKPGPAEPDVVAAGGRTQTQAISGRRSEFPALAGNNFNYYDPATSQFYRLGSSGGEPIALSSEKFPVVQNATWSSAGDKAILEFPDGSNIYYDFTSKEKATLPRLAQQFSFAPGDGQLAYKYIGASEDDRWLVTSDVKGQNQKIIEPIGDEAPHVKVDWSPNGQVLATFREVSSSAGDEVFFIGQNGENFLSLQTNGLGFKGEWSPSGKQILYSVYSSKTGYNPFLHIAGAEGDDVGAANRSLNIQTTPDKCAFAGETTVYCAAPRFLPEGSGIYPELGQDSTDLIYKIDLINNLSTLIAFPESAQGLEMSIDKMFVSSDENQLFFTDRETGRIQAIRLK